MHLVDTFIQRDLQRTGIEPQPFALLTQCSTTEPQEHKQFLECCMQFPGLCNGVLNVAMPLLGFCLNVFRAYMWYSKFQCIAMWFLWCLG